MAIRLASRRLASLSPRRTIPLITSTTPRRTAATATATATQGSNLPPELRDAIEREASLPTPDPPPDSQTAHLTSSQTPYMVATYVRPPPMFAKGDGSTLYDLDNRAYLDFTAGIAVNALGHCDPELARLIADQAKTLIHTSNLYHNPWTGLLSKRLVDVTRNSGAMRGAARAFICNSGSEANEAAIKFARKHARKQQPTQTEKYGIVSFQQSFHGRTMGALSATPNPKYQAPFAPMLPGFTYGTYNDAAAVDELITENTAGVLVEPIQGEGGVNVATPSFLQALRQRCDEVGALLVLDEIQCGMGRTGALWAHGLDTSKDAPHPDVLTTAKALGNGFPIGATLVTDAVADSIVTGDHGTTFGGNPLAARVGHYMLGRLSDPVLLAGVREKEGVFRAHLERLRRRFPGVVREVRGHGLILGVQLNADPTPVVTAARERGLLVITCGTNTLRLVPPLIVSEEEIGRGMRILGEAMESVFSKGDVPQGTRGQQEMAPAVSQTT